MWFVMRHMLDASGSCASVYDHPEDVVRAQLQLLGVPAHWLQRVAVRPEAEPCLLRRGRVAQARSRLLRAPEARWCGATLYTVPAVGRSPRCRWGEPLRASST
jgi:hypothetical protein